MPSRKAVISLEFPFCRERDLKALTQLMIFEMRDIGSESHLSELAERMRGSALYHANAVPPRQCARFRML